MTAILRLQFKQHFLSLLSLSTSSSSLPPLLFPLFLSATLEVWATEENNPTPCCFRGTEEQEKDGSRPQSGQDGVSTKQTSSHRTQAHSPSFRVKAGWGCEGISAIRVFPHL